MMGAQINIENEETCALADEIAGIEGVSLTQPVLDALRAKAGADARGEGRSRNGALCREIAARLFKGDDGMRAGFGQAVR